MAASPSPTPAPAPSPVSVAGTSASQLSGSTITPGLVGGVGLSQSGDFTDQDWQIIADALGTDVQGAKDMYQRFIQNYVFTYTTNKSAYTGNIIGKSQPNQATGAAVGVQSIAGQAPTSVAQDKKSGIRKGPSAREWAQNLLGSAYGVGYAIARSAQDNYFTTTGQKMPPDLFNQIVGAVQNMSNEDRQKLYVQWGQTQDVSKIGWIQGMITTYETAHPDAKTQQNAEDQVTAQLFQGSLGRPPTQDELVKFRNATQNQIQLYIDSQPMPGVNGITYGMYNQTYAYAKKTWEDNFGREPTQNEIVMLSGMNGDQRQNYIDNSQSSVPGVTIGKYHEYQKVSDKLKTELTDSEMNSFVKAMN